MAIFDYIIIGKNLSGLAFADTILSDSDATIALIDDAANADRHRRAPPNLIRRSLRDDRLGVASYTFKDWCADHSVDDTKRRDRETDIQSFCDHVLKHSMIPSGRVNVFERSEHLGGGRIRSMDTGNVQDLSVRNCIVDATRLPTRFHESFIPCFSVAKGVKVIRPFRLDAVLDLDISPFETFCVLGGGSVGTEMVLCLLDLGVPAESIRWVKSRDPWMLALRDHKQISLVQEILKSMAYASSPSDLCLRLENLGVIVRTSLDQTPTYFRPHLITHRDARRLCSVTHVIRRGHVHSISEIGMVLSRGAVPMPDRSLYLDCTGHGGSGHEPGPIFHKHGIDLAEIRLCDPCFSAAMIAAIALLDMSVEEKNKLCVPIRGHHVPELFLSSLLNQHAWFHDPDLRAWLERCRLDTWLQATARRLNRSTRIPQDLSAIRSILPRAIINLESMIQTDDASIKRRL